MNQISKTPCLQLCERVELRLRQGRRLLPAQKILDTYNMYSLALTSRSKIIFKVIFLNDYTYISYCSISLRTTAITSLMVTTLASLVGCSWELVLKSTC